MSDTENTEEVLEGALDNSIQHIAVTGSRHGMTPAQKSSFTLACIISMMPGEQSVLHHGCCVGVDIEAHELYLEYSGGPVEIHPGPEGNSKLRASIENLEDFTVHEGMPHLDRNKVMVDISEVVFGIPNTDEPERYPNGVAKGGTWSTIEYARKQGKYVIVIMPNGDFVSNVDELEED